MSIELLVQNLLRALADPLGVVVLIGSALFLYILWVAIRDSGPREPRPPRPSRPAGR